ncbi:MAG: hypothetical protein WC933_01850 [Candidatus Paceibacterota bacterium]|jgi:hypothetical protein
MENIQGCEELEKKKVEGWTYLESHMGYQIWGNGDKRFLFSEVTRTITHYYDTNKQKNEPL